MAFPTILLALFFVTIFGLYSAITGVGLSTVPRFARLVREKPVMSIKERNMWRRK